MSIASVNWKNGYTEKNIKKHYEEKIIDKNSVGLDRITNKKFNESYDENIDIICKKVHNGTYKFTRYKQLLISKGENKTPRVISIPTIRDKLTLSVLNEVISKTYGKEVLTPLVQVIINEIETEISQCRYNCFIKIDISGFYASIDHAILKKILKRKIRKEEIIDLIFKAIETPTVSVPVKSQQVNKKIIGIPEGLSISNVLANIYMTDIDKKYKQNNKLAYWRYVDDILILTSEKEQRNIEKMITGDLEDLKLKINDKKDSNYINYGFEYLGYRINNNSVNVRLNSVYKIEQTLEYLFSQYNKSKIKSVDLLEWKVNLKITGFILNNNKYGWLFFYSQITDIKVLYHLDWVVNKLVKRFNISKDIKFKRFVRTYNEIIHGVNTTKYIPNLDKLTMEDKRKLLSKIYGVDVRGVKDKEVDIRFKRIMKREIQDIEKDIQSIS